MINHWQDQSEWLETDGLGGFACGTATGSATRRYHGLLLVAQRPPTERVMLVNGFEAYLHVPASGVWPVSTARYADGVTHPVGHQYLENFEANPWPRWVYTFPDGTQLEQEVFVPHDEVTVVIGWRLRAGPTNAVLVVRPMLSCRDYHALHHENAAFRFDADVRIDRVAWRPYSPLPAVHVLHNGGYAHQPLWYRRFYYEQEHVRGFDAHEDLASPGEFRYSFDNGQAVMVLAAQINGDPRPYDGVPATRLASDWSRRESKRRATFPSHLHRAADQYLVRRGDGKSIIAGYPWFSDWGRDTFVSIRGLCHATGRFEDARDILLAWGMHLSHGMLPNRFPDRGQEPEFNSVDATLWYAVAVLEHLNHETDDDTRQTLLRHVDTILNHYAQGTRHGIRCDADGLLMAGEPGVQLTWMDARVDGREITPRIGKPVEIQALWLNALILASQHLPQWTGTSQRGAASFRKRFWNERDQCLYDVIDCDHQIGVCDPSFRPNQLFAIGGLPLMLIDMKRAGAVMRQAESRLLTPLGLRSLAPDEAGYTGWYSGGPSQRDAAYHQGTVWPWLMGPFVEAWVRVRNNTAAARREARERFLQPLLDHMGKHGLNHVSEIADGERPHAPAGCPFQAWSVAELMRLSQAVLADRVSPIIDDRHPNLAQEHTMSR